MPDGSTPPDLTLPVTITGVKEPIILERKANAAIVFVHESNQELGKIYLLIVVFMGYICCRVI